MTSIRPTRQDPRVAKLARTLATVHDATTDALAAKALEAVASVGESELALTYRTVATDSGPRAMGVAYRGDERIGSAGARCLVNPPVEELELHTRSAWNMAQVARFETQAFVETSALPNAASAPWRESAFYHRFAEPNGIDDQMRLLVVDESEYVGWIGLVRTRGTPRFRADDRLRLQPLVAPVTRLLVAAARMESLGPGEPADFVVRPDGHVEYASTSGRAWLAERGFAQSLASYIHALDRRDTHGAEPIAPWAIASSMRLDGPEGVRYLVHAQRPKSPTLPAAFHLSAAQRQVAELAASGATAAEIAAHRGSRTGTVRNQLKQIYRLLDVGSRVELARALEKTGRDPARQ